MAGKPWPAHRLKPCGTPAAYRRHLYHGEVPDQACVDANTRACAARRHRRQKRLQAS